MANARRQFIFGVSFYGVGGVIIKFVVVLVAHTEARFLVVERRSHAMTLVVDTRQFLAAGTGDIGLVFAVEKGAIG